MNISTSFELHVCTVCRSPLVQPVAWEPAGSSDAWQITLRCPECEYWVTGVFDGDSALRFDAALEDGLDRLLEGMADLLEAL